ncbi:hypothetical protein HK405_001420, partial [Cladochytrium tenue]
RVDSLAVLSHRGARCQLRRRDAEGTARGGPAVQGPAGGLHLHGLRSGWWAAACRGGWHAGAVGSAGRAGGGALGRPCRGHQAGVDADAGAAAAGPVLPGLHGAAVRVEGFRVVRLR